jgi:uncharacterized protein YqhQ
VLEGAEGGNARKLSAQWTKGKRWNIFGSIVLSFIGLAIVYLAIALILYVPLAIAGQESFVVDIIAECILNVMLSLFHLVLFLFY